MHLGLAIFATDESIAPGELARWAEDLGFESLFFPEHTHIPAGRETPYPGGGELPREYTRQLDPFVACTHAAAATTQLKVGTGICLVPQHEPPPLAQGPATRGRPPRRGRPPGPRPPGASTSSPAGGSSSAAAPAGTSTRCATTAPTRATAS